MLQEFNSCRNLMYNEAMPEINVERISTHELPSSPEQAGEGVGFERPRAVERPAEQPIRPLPPITASPAVVATPTVVSRIKEIENVLEEDLGEIYFQLSETDKLRFKTQGEVTANQIDALLTSMKATAGKVADLIRAWLMIIPGVNKFFLEQETKIKTDKIMLKYGR